MEQPKILVTGATGNTGRAAVDELLEKGAPVIGSNLSATIVSAPLRSNAALRVFRMDQGPSHFKKFQAELRPERFDNAISSFVRN
jgi:nucleoside-diphosphate-sugar epimerase